MRGLYLITNDDPIQALLIKLEAALATSQVAILQYRRKKVEPSIQPQEIEQIKALCEQYQTPFVINDDLDLAVRYGLGVHLGQSDGEVADAVARLPKGVIIGRTCVDSLALATQAITEGASYVAFGAIYATPSKPEAGCIGVEVVQQAKQVLDVPICAIGGLTVENAQSVIASGAALCAVISDILALPVEKIPARVNAWATLFVENIES